MATSNYDPFTHRKAIPPFPTIFGGQPGKASGVKPVQPGWEMPFQHVTQPSGKAPAVPDFPAEADGQEAWGGTPIPEFPSAANGWQQLVSGSPLAAPEQPAEVDDMTRARGIIGELDDLWKSLGGTEEETGAAHTEYPIGPAMSDEPHTDEPIGPTTEDRSWMFEQKEGWDRPKTGGGNYTPAPVVFQNSPSGGFGNTALDKRQRQGPAASTVRYYDRALARANAGNRNDQRRINRLDQRINARPTNG